MDMGNEITLLERSGEGSGEHTIARQPTSPMQSITVLTDNTFQ